MARARTDLHNVLLGLCNNVYYRAPESVKMKYPAIRYKKVKPDVKYANNKIYLSMNCYEITVISNDVDDPINESLSELQFCEWDREYQSNNLEHNVYTLFF